MTDIFNSIKPFAPLLLTFFLPRLINAYRTAKIAYKTRPPTRPLPPDATRSLNILFFGACLFFLQTLPTPSWLHNGLGLLKGAAQYENIFQITNSRLKIPTENLFGRLASLRPNGLLTSQDERLRETIGSVVSRSLYLHYGAETMTSCSFCSPEDPQTYLLYYLPTYVLLPHLLHLLLIGLSTSAPLSGPIASAWRARFTIASILIAALDIYTTCSYQPQIDHNRPGPAGLFWTAGLLRALVLCFFNAVAAFLIYASATNRFVLFMSPITPAADSETLQRQQAQAISRMTLALQMAHTKLNTYSITRNAVVRDERLKGVDDDYWRTVVAMEGPRNGGIWEDEEVQAAIARAMGSLQGEDSGLERVSRDARNFVDNVTRNLEIGRADV